MVAGIGTQQSSGILTGKVLCQLIEFKLVHLHASQFIFFYKYIKSTFASDGLIDLFKKQLLYAVLYHTGCVLELTKGDSIS